MTTEPCPRCGEPRAPAEPCPACGYEERHPGVLGAFGQALVVLARQPALTLPFLAPALVLLLVGASTLVAAPAVSDSPTLVEATTDVVSAFLAAWWFFVALGLAAGALRRDPPRLARPAPQLFAAAGAGAATAVAPLVVLAAINVWAPTGPVGALALVVVVVAGIGAFVVGGRAVGIPVEAAIATRPLGETVRRGLRRGRENGGLGLVFLAFLLFFLLALVPVVLDLAGLALGPWTIVLLGAAAAWPLGAWVGVAMALALAPRAADVHVFTCPRCGAEARAVGGRARCACGLEGPYYAGPG